MTTFADLYPDILLHLFQYFSLNELFDIFIDVIPYLSTLINQGHVQLCIDKNATDYFWKNSLSTINSEQILSLYISYKKLNEINLLKYSSVKSIILEDNRMINYLSLYPLNQFQNLIHLKNLSLKFSEKILNENLWLYHILHLLTLEKLKIDLMIEKNTILSQKNLFISQLPFQSLTIKYLEIKIPLLWTSILSLLSHFPCLETFCGYIYRINSNQNDTLLSKPNLNCFQTLKNLYLNGYFSNMSSIIHFFCLSIKNLRICRLMSTSVTNDNIFDIIKIEPYSLWFRLFENSQDLKQIKIHLLMSIETQKHINIEILKDRIRLFNGNDFCLKYYLYIIQNSMHNGYLTLVCDFKKENN